ncbi:MAG: DUF5320 domain-containing protein [Firmicutes bacterium]|nr:DUF5320 domain-containing protein [Bacillota bacterium]MCL5040029.1 DUF5320 domain-containing protein [Bacillota bacterium]
MPAFDGTGPRGLGPRTGWGMGFCRSGTYRGSAGAYPHFGRGRGYWGRGYDRGSWGLSRGWDGHWGPGGGYGPAYAPGYASGPAYYSQEEERAYLQDRLQFFRDELAATEKRLEELKSRTPGEKEKQD